VADDHDADILRAEMEELGASEPGPAVAVERGGASEWTSWSNLWQVPTILASVVLIAVGLWIGSGGGPTANVDSFLDQVDDLLLAGNLDDAKLALRKRVEPMLPEASTLQSARYRATVADWISESQRLNGVTTVANNRAITEGYAAASGMGLAMSPPRLETWGHALVDLGLIEPARDRVTDLEVLSVLEGAGPDARIRRNRLLRRLVETGLVRGNLDYDGMMQLIDSFHADSMLGAADRAWALARQAELRLEADRPGEAVDRLLLDVRRMEREGADLDPAIWGEFYTLLARGYAAQGQYRQARHALGEALPRLEGATAVRGDAMLLHATIDVAEGDLESALEWVEPIVRDYVRTRAHLPARLLRAESRSILGEHEGSLADYEAVLAALPGEPRRRDVHPAVVAASLSDRHDSALLLGELELALRYVSLAESIFDGDEVPTGVLRRVAMTSRGIAMELLDEGRAAVAADGRPVGLSDVAPANRSRANARFEQAGDYFLRHARALTREPDKDEDWAESLWLAADCYDQAGVPAQAIELMTEYIEGRSVNDPRRAEVTFRLAQAHEATGDRESAVTAYQRTIDEHPRSTFGTRAHVPLARSLRSLGRLTEAEQELRRVLAGQTAVGPEAVDYRDALIELGTVYNTSGQHARAIERLTEALDRYPDDERVEIVRFRLADSLHRHAMDLRRRLDEATTMPPAEREALSVRATAALEQAMLLFDEVATAYSARADGYMAVGEREIHRFASQYRGDCAYALGDYERAVRYYDDAARAFSDHHSSMMALVQIVNCYEDLGDARRADVAHQKAVSRLNQLPPEAFEDPQAIMDRAAWERWLERRPFGLAQSAEDRPG
jgi:tetratricopeptide (TPR) repeat protein